MTTTFRPRLSVPVLAVMTLLAAAPSAHAQYLLLSPTVVDEGAGQHACLPASTSTACESPRPSLFRPFTDAVGDFKRLPTRENLNWLVLGMSVAATTHRADDSITASRRKASTEGFKAGAVIGGTPLELGAAFATYAIGRASGSPRAMQLGGDLIRAQVMAELMTTGVKQSVRRARPEGSGFSFPSGHTAVTFASATVLQRHFGWKAGIPAYAVASYVAASRVQMKRHYLSDVIFGATLGIVAGRTVTFGHNRQWMLTPVVPYGGAGGGAGFTFVGKK
jgi:membrane-associated phospholipid phosphatase